MKNKLALLPIVEVNASREFAKWATKGIGSRCFNINLKHGAMTIAVCRQNKTCLLDVTDPILMCETRA